MKTHHDVKILPIYYDLVREGRKTFELRVNDRNYQNADTITLHEWENGEYTGRKQKFEIGYVLSVDQYVPTINAAPYVVFSLLEFVE